MRSPKFLGAAIIAMASATMVSSCIETDEPASIEKLRTAKAEFIAAETAYKTAEIARVNAEAALEELNVKLKEVELAQKQYEAAIAEAKSQTAIEEAKMALEDAKKEHELHMLTANEEVAKAQQSYDLALKEIEIANATALDPEAGYFADYTNAYYAMKDAKEQYLGYASGSSFVYGTSQMLVKKQEALVEAEEELAKAISQDWDANDKATELKWDVIGAQKAYDQIKNGYDFFSTVEGLDSTAIVAKIKELANQMAALDKKRAALEVEKAELENVANSKEADYNKASDTYYKEYNKVNEDLNKYKNESKYYTFDVTGDIVKEYFANNNVNGFTYNGEDKLVSNSAIANEDLNSTLDNYIYYYPSILYICSDKIISEEELAQYTQSIKELNSQLSSYKATYNADSAKWAQTLEAYKKAALDYKWSEENQESTLYIEVRNAINDYNSASEKTDAMKQNIATKIANYYKLRKAFDGYENTNTIYNGSDYVTYSEFFDGQTLTTEELAQMGTLYQYTVLGYNEKDYDGAFGDFGDASYKFFSKDDRYTMFTEEEVDESYNYYKNGEYYYVKFGGSFGKYKFAILDIEKMQNEIDSRKDWMALQAAVQNVLDTYEAKVTELTNAKADKYAELNPLNEAMLAAEEAWDNAKDAVDEKDAEIDALDIEYDAIENLMDVYDIQWDDVEDLNDFLSGLKEDLEYAENDLEDAKGKLAAFEKGEYGKAYAIEEAEEAVEEAKEEVAKAEAANEEAKAEYEAAKATFDKIYAIVSAE